MIKLIANITVERIEKKADSKPAQTTPTSSTTATPTTTSESKSLVSGGGRGNSVAVSGEAAPASKKPQQPIDLSELRSRLQNAYRTPPPKIAVSHVTVM